MVSNTRSWGNFFLSFRELNRKWEEQAFMIFFQRLITEESFFKYDFNYESVSLVNGKPFKSKSIK